MKRVKYICLIERDYIKQLNKSYKKLFVMISIQHPQDLLSVSLHNVFSYRLDDKEFIDLVQDWNKKILIEIDKFYPLMIIFKQSQIGFEFQNIQHKPDLKVSLDLNTMLDIAYGRIGPITAVLKRRLRIKGIYKIGLVLHFKKVFLDTLKMVAADPIEKYYELDLQNKEKGGNENN